MDSQCADKGRVLCAKTIMSDTSDLASGSSKTKEASAAATRVDATHQSDQAFSFEAENTYTEHGCIATRY